MSGLILCCERFSMGCSTSKPAARVLPPLEERSTSKSAACVLPPVEERHTMYSGRFSGLEAEQQEECAECERKENGFPLHAMRMHDFLTLKRLEPHNTLVEQGLVVPVDFEGEHRGEQLNFVSHQWLAYSEADPDGAHLETMQAIFRMAIAGESIFRSEEDWNAYSKGYTAENAASASTKHASATQGSFGDEEAVLRSQAHFLASIADGWVWMDYISSIKPRQGSNPHAT
jgi:hypothetical protein